MKSVTIEELRQRIEDSKLMRERRTQGIVHSGVPSDKELQEFERRRVMDWLEKNPDEVEKIVTELRRKKIEQLRSK